MIRRPPRYTRTDTLFPYPTLFLSDRSAPVGRDLLAGHGRSSAKPGGVPAAAALEIPPLQGRAPRPLNPMQEPEMNRILSDAIDAHGGFERWRSVAAIGVDRKSTRLNSSH